MIEVNAISEFDIMINPSVIEGEKNGGYEFRQL